MHFFAFLSLSGVTVASALQRSGENTAYLALKSVIERQTLCTPVTAPFTCARSCGPGYTECISFPNCYNPGLGQSCCSNGKYCPKGTYCTNAGCCPDGVPLAQCGATITLSVIPPQTTSTQTPTTEISTTEIVTTETSTAGASSSETSTSETTEITLPSTTDYTYSATSTSTSVYSSISLTSATPSPATTSSRHTSTGAPTNSTTPNPSPTFVTAGAGKNAIAGVLPAVGGIIAFCLAL